MLYLRGEKKACASKMSFLNRSSNSENTSVNGGKEHKIVIHFNPLSWDWSLGD